MDGDDELANAIGVLNCAKDVQGPIIVAAGETVVLTGEAVASDTPYKIRVSLSTKSGLGGVFGSACDASIVASKARSSIFFSGFDSAANNACRCDAPSILTSAVPAFG